MTGRRAGVPLLEQAPVPARALYLSLVALLVPFAASGVVPGLGAQDLGVLVWIAAFIPAFLLSYYRGWQGSAVALAGGMAALALTYHALYLLDIEEPDAGIVLLVVLGYLGFSIGLGVVTELLHRARRAAEAQALTDQLTGLANRRHLEVYLSGAATAARTSHTPLSVAAFDLDRFKWLNDTHGHAAGDEVLRRFADTLRARARPGWLFARAGGEEFVAVLPDVDWEAAWSIAEAVREDVQDLDVRWKPVTVSAGVATLGPDTEGWRALLAEADAAVYRAKELGRDRVEVASGKRPTSGREVANPHLGEDRWTAARGIVVLPEGPARRSVRRALELNGLHVEEWSSSDEVPIDVGALAPVAVVVGAAASADGVAATGEDLERAVGREVTKILFAPEPVERAYRSAPLPGVVLVAGEPSGEGLLAALPRAVEGVVVRSPGPGAPRGESRTSRLGADGAPLTEGAIVVVDDERSNRVALQRTLEELGFRNLTLLSGGAEALDHVRSHEADLVVLDLHMPEVDGFGFLDEIQRDLDAGSYLPILVVTGDHKWDVRQRALRMGARDFLNKPFDVAELGARVLNLLETRQLHLQMADTNRLLESRVRRRTWELARAKDEILFRLARAAEYRDDVTGRHAERVGEASRILGLEMGLPEPVTATLRRAAPLHDIGKIAIPDAILLKEGPLEPEEMEFMRRHTIIGADLLEDSSSEIIQEARTIALTHHERWDGLGYPGGLAEERIPLSGRIVALADALDAVTHARPYKGAVPFEDARRRLREDAGSAFDPRVVEAMEGAVDELEEVMGEHE